MCLCLYEYALCVSVTSKSVGLVGTEIPVWTVTILYFLYDNGRVAVWSILPQQHWILGLLWDWLRNNSCVSGLQSRRRKDGRFHLRLNQEQKRQNRELRRKTEAWWYCLNPWIHLSSNSEAVSHLWAIKSPFKQAGIRLIHLLSLVVVKMPQ